MCILPQNRVQWQQAEPGREGDVAETHCSICLQEGNVSSILAHRLHLNDPNSAFAHRVHRMCLLGFQGDFCPQCRVPYYRYEVPGTPWKERFAYRIGQLQVNGKNPLAIFFIFWAVLFFLGWQLRNYLVP